MRLSLLDRQPAGVDPAHLAGADPDRFFVLGEQHQPIEHPLPVLSLASSSDIRWPGNGE